MFCFQNVHHMALRCFLKALKIGTVSITQNTKTVSNNKKVKFSYGKDGCPYMISNCLQFCEACGILVLTVLSEN